jgi:hypothetical protein
LIEHGAHPTQFDEEQRKLEIGGKGEAELKRSEDVLVGLKGQYARLVGLVQGLGIEVEREEDSEPRIERRVVLVVVPRLVSVVISRDWRPGTSLRLVDTDDDLPAPHLPRTLVDTDDFPAPHLPRTGGDQQPSSEPPPHVRIHFDNDDDDNDDERSGLMMKADEDEMRRANVDMMQMQRRMLSGEVS